MLKLVQNNILNGFIYKKLNNQLRLVVRGKKTHRAALLTEYDKPLTVTNVKNDDLKKGMVRIAVSYCSLNKSDVKILSGFYKNRIELPIIPGHEFSGNIIECGKDLKNEFKIGDRVVALQSHDACGGGLATQAIVDENDVFHCTKISLKEAAILPYGHGTALLAFSKYCEINENDLVIVTAGPGGLGLGAIEVAASVFKAKVIAICDTEDTSSLIRDKGAFNAISASEGLQKVYKNLEKILNGKKAKVGIDAVGNGFLHLLDEFVDRENGKLLSIDPFYNPSQLKSLKLEYKNSKKDEKESSHDHSNIEKRVQHVDLSKYRKTDVEFYRQLVSETLSLCEDEIISAYVSGTFKLDEINKAIDFINKKKCTGKVLIDIQQKDNKDD